MSTSTRFAEEFRSLRHRFSGLSFYEAFEHAVVLVLTMLIVFVVASATWNLALGVLALVLANQIDPSNQQVFQAVFGMIFTVIMALEFKHSLLVVLARQESVVRVRSIVLIALLAVARKFIILDIKDSTPAELFALAAAILALGVVYWLVRDQDGRAAAVGNGADVRDVIA
jgi:uncharacterized membrane protein (DUF373 family)